jgi:hypothetical protein
MLAPGEINDLERRLRASIVALNKSKIMHVTVIEVIDDAALWLEPYSCASKAGCR